MKLIQIGIKCYLRAMAAYNIGFAQAGLTNKLHHFNLYSTSVNGLDRFFSRLHIRLRM
jgi:hypothetical protein